MQGLLFIILLPVALICLILTSAIIVGILELMIEAVKMLVEAIIETIKEIMKC